jgi:hypothetical protein
VPSQNSLIQASGINAKRCSVIIDKIIGSPPRRASSGKLRALVTAALMLVSLPAAAELRIVQSALPKSFPSIGDAVVGCHDPANTVDWIEIITGKKWERTVQDGEIHTLTPSLGDVATGVRGFFHAYIRTGECSPYEDGDEVTVESHAQWYGVDMMCVSDPHRGCYWTPAVDLQGGDHDFGAARRR